MTKIANEKPAATTQADEPARPVIRPLYGVFVDTIKANEAKVKADISGTVALLEHAIDSNDGITGALDKSAAHKALKQLKAAVEALKSAPSAAKAEEEDAVGSMGVIRPLYGVFINTEMNKVKTQIGGEISEIKTALSGSHTDQKAVGELKKALGDLEKAMKALDKV